MMSLLEAWLANRVSNRMRESPLLRWNALRSPSKEALLQTRLVQQVGIAGEDGHVFGVVHAPFLVHAALVDGAAAHAVLLELGDEKLLVVEQVELVIL